MAAREAVIQITSKIRTYLYHDSSFGRDASTPTMSSYGHNGTGSETCAISSARNSARDHHQGNELSSADSQNNQSAPTLKPLKVKNLLILS